MSIRIYVHRKHQIKCRCVPGHTRLHRLDAGTATFETLAAGDVTRREDVLWQGRELLKRDLLGRSL